MITVDDQPPATHLFAFKRIFRVCIKTEPLI